MSGSVFVWKNNFLERLISAHKGPIFSLFTTLQDGFVVTAGKAETNLKLWDPLMRKSKEIPLGFPLTVKAITRLNGKIAVGTIDNSILEIDERGSSKILIDGHGPGEVWGLACHPQVEDLMATVSDDKSIRIWNLQTKSLYKQSRESNPCRCCAFTPDGTALAIGDASGQVLILNTKDLKTIGSRRDNGSPINDIKFSPDGTILAVANQRGLIDLYGGQVLTKLPRNGHFQLAHEKSALHLDFSSDGAWIKVVNSDYETTVFNYVNFKLKNETQSQREWATCTAPVGADVIGVWGIDTGKGDINAIDRSKGGGILATGDDYGAVKVFPYPMTSAGAEVGRYFGHSANVTNVRFTCNDEYLVSTGGDDCCVMVWKTVD